MTNIQIEMFQFLELINDQNLKLRHHFGITSASPASLRHHFDFSGIT
jgi:hypothetical protein